MQIDATSTSRWKSLQNVRVVKEEMPEEARARAPKPAIHVPLGSEPYRAYKPRPFTRAERSEVTILFGGLHWRAERVIQGSMENLGYRAQVLPTATREDLLTGRELADIGQCCPTSFTTGNLANFLRTEAQRIGAAEVAKKYIYFTAGSCGACRFGQYHQSYELALRNAGLDSFRLFNTKGDNYTWWTAWSNARARNVGWRIDYVVVSESLANHLVGAAIHADQMGSDHCPVSIDIQ